MKTALLSALAVAAATAHAQELVTLQPRPGVTQVYFLAPLPQTPQAVAVLFPGGGGYIRIRNEGGEIRFGPNNFVVRTRTEFTDRGVVAAIVDAPSDQQGPSGMSDHFRLGDAHQADVSAVVADLRKRFPGLPVFLVGTSRGTISAAALGARMGTAVDGVALTATLFLPAKRGPGLSGFDYSSIKAPLLFAHHRQDGCMYTPYREAARLSDKYPLISVTGGLPPKSEPCEALSEHGFLGKETETVEAIANWMLKKPYRKDIE